METSEERDSSIFHAERAAKNQSLFRAVNERIKPLNESFSFINPRNDFVCECADDSCTQTIVLSVEEYEAVRATPNRFAVAPQDPHIALDVETIVEKHEHYWVVEMFGHAGALAAKLDPRTQARE